MLLLLQHNFHIAPNSFLHSNIYGRCWYFAHTSPCRDVWPDYSKHVTPLQLRCRQDNLQSVSTCFNTCRNSSASAQQSAQRSVQQSVHQTSAEHVPVISRYFEDHRTILKFFAETHGAMPESTSRRLVKAFLLLAPWQHEVGSAVEVLLCDAFFGARRLPRCNVVMNFIFFRIRVRFCKVLFEVILGL